MSKDQSTVLLVEDEPHIRLFVSELLDEAGFKVIEAANASEALAILRAGRTVNVLLTDVDLASGNNGFELAQTVCKSFSHIEILILTGRQWPSSRDLPARAILLCKPCPNEAILKRCSIRVASMRNDKCEAVSRFADYASATVGPRSQNGLSA